VYLLLFISVSATPWRQTSTFDLAEIVYMALSLAYLYEAIQVRQGIRRVQSRGKFERNWILYAIAEIILKVISNSRFVAWLVAG
jgi:hypothetical protein